MSRAKHALRARLCVLVVGCAASVAAVATGTTVISGFGGPLFGLTAGRPGELFVADASVGVTPIRHGLKGTPIVLPGVSDMSLANTTTLWAVTGAGPAGPRVDSGQGVHLISNGKVTKIVNLFEFEAANNPHTGVPDNAPDSNPYDVQALSQNAALVADAGGNDLLRIDRWGNVKVLAVFPDEVVSTANIKSFLPCPPPGSPPPPAGSPPPPALCNLPPAIPAQPVPTSIAIDRFGYIYVGELKGFPAPTNESNIWRVSPRANGAQCGASPDCVKVFDGGFTSVIDLAFGPDGLLYVTELDEGSWAAIEIFGQPKGGTINACNVRLGFCREVADDLPQPIGTAFDHQGALWATQHSLEPGEGEVVKVRGRVHPWWRHPKFSWQD